MITVGFDKYLGISAPPFSSSLVKDVVVFWAVLVFIDEY